MSAYYFLKFQEKYVKGWIIIMSLVSKKYVLSKDLEIFYSVKSSSLFIKGLYGIVF